jgi:nucleotide-binding universal stress UspA family protein
MDDTRRVVVGVDGSEDSKLALRWAVTYAESFGGQVEAVAAPEIMMTASLTDAPTGEDYVRDAQRRLDDAIAEVLGDRTDVTIERTVVGDRAARALVDAAKGAHVLVIGSSGHGELPGMHIGSTTNYCVHHAPCPVMVLRARTA